jgi:hypothetical protein
MSLAMMTMVSIAPNLGLASKRTPATGSSHVNVVQYAQTNWSVPL